MKIMGDKDTSRNKEQELVLNQYGNMGDHLFLSNSDHPEAQLSTTVFDGSNFLP